jgi:hypothetical protein
MKLIRIVIILLCLNALILKTTEHMPIKLMSNYSVSTSTTGISTTGVTDFKEVPLADSYKFVGNNLFNEYWTINTELYLIQLGLILLKYLRLYLIAEILYFLFNFVKNNSLFKRIFEKKKEVYYVRDLPKKE